MKGSEYMLNFGISLPLSLPNALIAFSSPMHRKVNAKALLQDVGIIKEEIDIANVTDEYLNDPRYAKKIKEKLLNEFYPAALKKAPKPLNMSHSQYLNYLAIHILEETGNEFPTQKAIDFVESFLRNFYRKLKCK